MVTRRHVLVAAAAAWAVPLARARSSDMAPTQLFAAWDDSGASRIGLIACGSRGLRMVRSMAIPTRAHGIATAGVSDVLVVARRPGDWMLRLRVGEGGRFSVQRWCWIEPQRSFNGHAIASPEGRLVFTTETDLDSGQGLVGVRDAKTLRKLAEWPTGGRDPHELVWDAAGAQPALLVANGGIATLPETGRVKHDLRHMDSSLVRLCAASGEVLQQWHAADRRLSLRHVCLRGNLIGVALQAEHDEPDDRLRAPVLAIARGETLRSIVAPRILQGYGGDIHATSQGFAVSCPRANGVALFAPDGGWAGFVDLPEACALAGDRRGLYAGGANGAMRVPDTGAAEPLPSLAGRMDNHWVIIPRMVK